MSTDTAVLSCVLQQIKDNGGLAKLVAYITDAPPPEEEDTKSKGKKGGAEKGPSRAGKKGKEDGEWTTLRHRLILIAASCTMQIPLYILLGNLCLSLYFSRLIFFPFISM